MLWPGTADSAVDLLPPGGFAGAVTGMSGDQQVFIGFEGGVTRATLWRGTADSAVDLHPLTGFLRTTAEDTNGRQQVGYGQGPATGGAEHALLWNGSNVPSTCTRSPRASTRTATSSTTPPSARPQGPSCGSTSRSPRQARPSC